MLTINHCIFNLLQFLLSMLTTKNNSDALLTLSKNQKFSKFLIQVHSNEHLNLPHRGKMSICDLFLIIRTYLTMDYNFEENSHYKNCTIFPLAIKYFNI